MFAPYGSQSSPMGMAATSAATPLYLPPSPSASHGMHVGRMSWDVLGVMQGGIMALQLYMLTLVSQSSFYLSAAFFKLFRRLQSGTLEMNEALQSILSNI